ncbi:AbrB/MazE/SpoVT family DNA-binding domain-containing protein [Sphingobacterium kitahiroshimense]|uniref:AbrB/MazE/SpoVT family DNA-binding domain-containing protein n=1 Tax=Sphingobacterium kitahiroshimense TaxID=470446 RepID=UPI00320A62A7
METKIRKIGNSLGVVISKAILVASDINDTDMVNISFDNGKIVIEKAKRAREGWEKRFKKAKDIEGQFFPSELGNKFDEEEWTWE